MEDVFVLKVAFDGRSVIVGRYATFNKADEVAVPLRGLDVVEGVRVEVWSARIAKRYGMPVDSDRIENLLVRLDRLGAKMKSGAVTYAEGEKVTKNINRLVLEDLNAGKPI